MRWNVIKFGAAGLAAALNLAGCGSSSAGGDGPGTTDGTSVVLAGLFANPGGGATPARARGIELAIDDVNKSGLLSQPLSFKLGLFDGETDRTAVAKAQMEQQGAVGIISEYSSTALRVLRLTNQPQYAKVVQCSGSSTNTRINNPATADSTDGIGADRNGTLYRTVGNDLHQAKLTWLLVPNKDKVAGFFVDDAYGSSFRDEVRKYAADAGGLKYDETFAVDYRTAAEQSKVDAILAKNKSGEIDSVILISLVEQFGPVVRGLVEADPPFRGTIIAADGAVDDAAFASLPSSFSAWLQRPGNKLVATSPDGRMGNGSEAFINRLQSAYPGETMNDPFVPNYADCVYTMAIAMAYAEKDGKTIADYRDYMGRFAAGTMDGATRMNASVTSIQEAKGAIVGGSRVQLDAASGVLAFDADGDRVGQLYRVFTPSGGAKITWQPSQVWDPDNDRCISGCGN